MPKSRASHRLNRIPCSLCDDPLGVRDVCDGAVLLDRDAARELTLAGLLGQSERQLRCRSGKGKAARIETADWRTCLVLARTLPGRRSPRAYV